MFDKTAHFIQSEDAEYVQVIHTSFLGVSQKIGHIDIFLNYKSESLFSSLFEKHGLGVYLHAATATKKVYLIAEVGGNGTMITDTKQPLRKLRSKECLIGIFGTFDERKKGKKYEITLTDREQIKQFWKSLGEYKKDELFW